MLQNKRQNYHHSHMPNPGEIVELPQLSRHMLDRDGKYIVESFNLTDSADYHYSKGIHCVNLRRLRDGQQITVAGQWCDVLHWLN